MTRAIILSLVLLIFQTGIASAQADSTPEDTLNAFRAALEAGDRAAALSFLSPDLVVYEGGNVDAPRAGYADHHLGSDIAFHVNVGSKLLTRKTLSADGLVTLISEYRQSGSFRGMAINAHVTETAVLERADDGWAIAHLHWSSRMLRPDADHSHD